MNKLFCRVLGHAWGRIYFDTRIGYWSKCQKCGYRRLIMHFD